MMTSYKPGCETTLHYVSRCVMYLDNIQVLDMMGD